MRAVVLVGGFGTRLRPLTLDTPKQMLPVGDVSMFERVLSRLASCGISEAVISLGFRPDRFVEAFPDGTCAGVKLHYAIEPEPLDTAGAIRFAALDAGINETFLVVNGDVLTDLDYSWLIAEHERLGAEATIHLIGVDDPSRFGVVPTDDSGRVLAFVEKPEPGTEPTDQINAGTYVMEPSVLEKIPADRRVSVERETFPLLVESESLYAVSSEVYWVDAGTPVTYRQANLDLIDGTRDTEAPVHSSAVIDPTAEVRHSVIGAGATVGPRATVVDSVVMADAEIGEDSLIETSVVGKAATTGVKSRVTHGSVVGHGHHVEDGFDLFAGTIPDSSTWT